MKKSKTSKSVSGNNGAGEKFDRKDFLIVGIGASAGGIQALKEFFENVSVDSGLAYVVILHLSPEHESHLAEVLQRAARIPVMQVTERVKVEPNRVYVVPPSQHLGMEDGHIGVSPNMNVEERRAPVDIFFRTLAESHHGRAVAVVLSGTGADGSMGLKRVKENGGVAFVQNPREAEFSEMPRNSIATDLVDAVLNVREIPSKIAAYQANIGAVVIQDTPESRPDEDQAALREIFTHLRVRTGHDFSNYKRASVLRRIERRIDVSEAQNLPAYAAYLRDNADEANALLKDLLISVTNFFRDKDAFEFLEREVLPKIVQGKHAEDQIRVWVAGCATGEEAYSLAMLLAEQVEDKLDAPSIQIFAGDIDDAAIQAAREGFYTINDAADVSPERLRRFFTKDAGGFRVRRELRETILFANHNLIKDPPFSHLDLVTCRNLLIYLNETAQERAMETFHFALNPGGFLFVGTSETTDGSSDLFANVSRENHVYQSRGAKARIAFPAPEAPPVLRFTQAKKRFDEKRVEDEKRQIERISFGDLHGQLLERYAPPSIVVNENYDIAHLSENAGRFLQIAGGEPTKNLLRLIRPEMRLELRAALYQAVNHKTNVEAAGVKVQTDGRAETINIHVRPVLRPDDTARGFLLVIFESAKQTAEQQQTEEQIITALEPLARQLEEELERVKSQLRQSIEQFEIQTEELRASNEELQAINEELRSSAEELETSREELQSVNEELITVNQELKIKIEELSLSNSDFQNLMNSTDIGTIFLDRAFRVKQFTPSAREVFNLIEADLNRPLADISTKLDFEDLRGDLEGVLDTLQTAEREIQTHKGKWYLMRIFPYRTAEDKINGVVITFVEITRRRLSEAHLRDVIEQLKLQTRVFDLTLSTIADLVYIFDRDGRFLYANQPLLELFGKTPEEAIGKTMAELDYDPQIEANLLRDIRRVFDTKQSLRGETPYTSPQGIGGLYEYIFNPVFDADGAVESIVGATRDVTERKNAEAALRQSEERLRLLVESASDYAIFTLSTDNRIDSWNAGAEKVFGWTEKEILGQSGEIIFTPEDRESGAPEQEIKTALKNGSAPDERFHVRRDGSRFYASGVMTLLKDAGGEVRGFAKIARDMTERLAAERALRDKEMLQKLVGAQETERKRIARDLHDELGQQLTALRLKLEGVRKLCGEDNELCAKIDETQLIAKSIDNGVDFLAWELRPAALDDLGLFAALEKYVREWSHYSGVSAELISSGLKRTRFAPEVETNLYRIAQESLNNTHKHAAAKRAEVLLEKRGDLVVLIIEDDGKGFDPEKKASRRKGLGLIGIRERATLIGGAMEIESAPGRGTTIHIRVPAKAVKKSR